MRGGERTLDHCALVHLGLVVALVLARVVGVDGVRHVRGDEERGAAGLFVGGGCVGLRVHVFVRLVTPGV